LTEIRKYSRTDPVICGRSLAKDAQAFFALSVPFIRHGQLPLNFDLVLWFFRHASDRR
jgi:hypothetical protein